MITKYSSYLHLINGAALLVCAVFNFTWRDTFLVALMLFLPFIDQSWSVPNSKPYKYRSILRLFLIGVACLILILIPNKLNFILSTILLVALPEEWFFRAYFMQRVGSTHGYLWESNIVTSVLFAVLHVPTQGWIGLSVFFPSLVLGCLYQQHRDIVVVILLHSLLNIFYILFLREVIIKFDGYI